MHLLVVHLLEPGGTHVGLAGLLLVSECVVLLLLNQQRVVEVVQVLLVLAVLVMLVVCVLLV